MGSIPALPVADFVLAVADASVANTAVLKPADSGGVPSPESGFGKVFADQIADTGVLETAATETVEAPQLLDLASPTLHAAAADEPPPPTLGNAVSRGLASLAPLMGAGDVFTAKPEVPTSLDTLGQLPRNGRPIEAQPDRASYFTALPPSPLAQTQARLVQILSSQATDVMSVAPAGHVPGQMTDLKATEATLSALLADLESEYSLTPASVPDATFTSVTFLRTSLSAVPSTVVDALEKGVSEEAESTFLHPVPNKVLSDVDHITWPDADSSEDFETASASLSLLVETPKAVTGSRLKTSQQTGDLAALASVRMTIDPIDMAPISIATSLSSAKRVSNQTEGDDPDLPAITEPWNDPVLAAVVVPGDVTRLHLRQTEPPPASEQVRLQDPLRGAEPATNSTPATTSSAPSIGAIPFALPSVNGGSTTAPATLPNPLERNIARQLTQQLSTPLATLASSGAQRKGAVDRSLVIRLTPPELGTVRIEISQRNGELIVRMHAEDPAVRQAIERMLPSLRTDLRQADSPLQHITVESSSSGDRNSGDRSGGDDRGAWQGQQHQRQERAFDGGDRSHRRDGDRPIFSLSGMPAIEPVTVAPRSRSLGGLSSTTGVDALA